MPKPKHRFRVRVINFGPIAGGLELTQQVVSVSRPTVAQQPVEVHSYNSVAYYAGKHSWNSIDLSVRDDVTNAVAKLVGHQEQKQMNHFEQTSALAGSNYKFEAYIETLDGGNDGMLEQWYLEGCFLEQINYGEFDYSTADAMTIQMTVRYDNATQSGGLMPENPELKTGPMI
ncbi:MAG: hypothetical protein EOO77_17095 [Oxalobacteraceae bacterium]|nr:MAG: hypothetical protein EOO77_17095 [Oxalobacteraceae bacterium]